MSKLPPYGWLHHSEQTGDDALAADCWAIKTVLASRKVVATVALTSPPPEVIEAIEHAVAHGCVGDRYGRIAAAMCTPDGKFGTNRRGFVSNVFDTLTGALLGDVMLMALFPDEISTTAEEAIAKHYELVKRAIEADVVALATTAPVVGRA